MKKINPYKKCLGCHLALDEDHFFCSITCMILCGYKSLSIDRPHKNVQELRDNPELVTKFITESPKRPYDRALCECHHTKEEIEESKRLNHL